jgi:predicted DNA-binding transcriptional regulator AlpA
MTETIKPRLLNVEETANYLSIAPKTIRNRLGPKAPDPFPVKPKRIGKRVLFDRRDLDRYIDELAHE